MRFSLCTVWGCLALTLSTLSAYADPTDLYVGRSTPGTVTKFTTSGSSLGDFVTVGSGGLNDTTEFKFGPDGNLYVGGYFDSTLKEFNGTTGAFIRDLGSGLSNPFDVAFDSNGNMYVSNFGNSTISQINVASGAVTRTYSGFDGPTGIMFNMGKLLVANFNTVYNFGLGNSSDVVALNTSTGAITPFATGFTNVRDLASGPGGDVYILDTGAGKIDVTSSAGGSWSTLSNVFQQYPVSDRQTAQSLVYDNGDFYTVISSDNNMGVASYNGSTGAFVRSFPLDSNNVDGIAVKSEDLATSTPEPGSVGLLAGLGVTVLSLLARRHRK